jgi:hypothetical protein
MARLSLFIICLLIFPSLSLATNLTLSGYSETGKRTQAEDFEEEDDDGEYTFRNYHLRLEHRVYDRFTYSLGSFIYDKDYKVRDALDNISNIFDFKGSYYLKMRKEGSLRLNIRLRYKEKRYRNAPSNEYNQVVFYPGLTYEKKDSYSIDLSAGINNYDYVRTGGNDQFKIFSKIGAKRYFLDKNLMVKSSYKLEAMADKRTDRQKNKSDFMLGFDYVFDLPYISKIITRAKFGQRDTKDDDERDEDFDYKYNQFYIKTTHKIDSVIKTDLKYQYFKKDYLTANLDHNGFYIRNTWRYIVLADKTNEIIFNFTAKHKDVNYTLTSGRDYQKETLGIGGIYRRRKDLKASVSLQGNFYDYKDSTKDKNRYYVKLSFEKLFPERELRLSLDLKYKFTDNKQRNDTEEESVRLAFRQRF